MGIFCPVLKMCLKPKLKFGFRMFWLPFCPYRLKTLSFERGLLTWPNKDDRKCPCKMTENAEDCKRYYLSLTENQDCKRYDEYKYDRKRTGNICLQFYQRSIHIYSTVYYENKVNICLQYCQRSIHVYSSLWFILILVVMFTVVIFGQI